MTVGPSFQRTSSTSSTAYFRHDGMKIVTILVILCRFAHQNNSNYILLLIAMYMYSVGARVDTITLFNHFGLLISYDVLQKKLKEVITSIIIWIKSQGSNCKLIGSWDNFEFCENIYEERIGDKVKFRSVTMALWIKKDWRIPDGGLQQWMSESKRESPTTCSITSMVFGRVGVEVREKCQHMHQFNAFRAAFPKESFSYQPSMPTINIIDCKREKSIKSFTFAPFMFSESSTTSNLIVFKDLNILQMRLEKTDAQWLDRLTLWWGDLKTANHMLSIQSQGVGMNRPYN